MLVWSGVLVALNAMLIAHVNVVGSKFNPLQRINREARHFES